MGNTTISTKSSVQDYMNGMEDFQKKEDCEALLSWMKEVTSLEPVMWGDSIVGFGKYHYTYDSGREGDFFMVGFSARKKDISIYIMPGFQFFEAEMKVLGKHKTGTSCLYINKLSDVQLDILKSIIHTSYQYMKNKYKDK